MNLTSILALAGGATQTQGNSMQQLILPIIMWVAIIGIFYFMALRPQKKQQKEHDLLVSNIEAGDSVVTSSGFFGVVIQVVDDDVVVVEFGSNKNCRIPMKRSHISEVEKKDE